MLGSYQSSSNDRELVKRTLKTPVSEKSMWDVVSANWFNKWKLYVDYEAQGSDLRASDEIDSLHPGPIDNHDIRGNSDEELKQGIVENEDFVFLFGFAADALFKKFGGGPRFKRQALRTGLFHSQKVQISLYKVKFEIYICNKQNPYPNKEDSNLFHVLYFEKNASIRSILVDVRNKLRLYGSPRTWFRENREQERDSESLREDCVESLSSPPSNSSPSNIIDSCKRPRIGRLLTTDLTDWDNNWRLMRNFPEEMTAMELLEDKDSVELLVEVPFSMDAKETDWPRAHLTEKWKNDLRKDDILDAQDKTKVWYEGVVKQVDQRGVHIHFRGWSERFDEIIPTEQLVTRVSPLHTKTKSRQLWREHDYVDLRVNDEGDPVVFVEAVIKEIDLAHGKMKVAYSEYRRQKIIRETKLKASIAQANKAGTLNTDDVNKQKADLAEEKGLEEYSKENDVERWLDVMSEDVLYAHTHTKKTISTPGSAHSHAIAAIASRTSTPYTNNFDRYELDKHTKGVPPVVGAVGLQNLGNTCFMNSILQCLSNTEALTKLFLHDAYKADLNTDNPLGHSGKLATVYAKLIKDMWNDGYVKIVPREFKTTIGEFQPQFAGYDQQDSQELMGFLLDGLHEDLNRVAKKPHVTKIESKGRPDALISAESWRRYLLRNDSALVDRCFGQLKSHVTCVNCKTESVTFDEFSSISLPIPVKNTKKLSVEVHLLPLGSTPVLVDVEYEVNDTMAAFKSLLIKALRDHKVPIVPSVAAVTGSFITPSVSMCRDVNNLSVTDSRTTTIQTSSSAESDEDTVIIGGSQEQEGVEQDTQPLDDMGAMDVDYDVVDREELAASLTNATNQEPPAISESGDDAVFDDKKWDLLGGIRSAGKKLISSVIGSTDRSSNDSLPDLDSGALMAAPPSSAAPLPPRPPSTSSTATAAPVDDGFYFHYVQLSSYSIRVNKSYNAAEHANTPISAFGSKYDKFVALQLEHNCPDPAIAKNYSSYGSYGGSAYNYSSGVKKEKAEAPVESRYAYVDITVVIRRSEFKSDVVTSPMRVSFVRHVTTNREVHDKVWEAVRRFVKDDSHFAQSTNESRPYEVEVANSWSTTALRKLPLDDAPFTALESEQWLQAHFSLEGSDDKDHFELDLCKNVIRAGVSPRNASSSASVGLSSMYGSDDESASGQKISIYDCMNKFIEREQLAEAETLYCSNCKQHLAPIKKMDVWAAPDVLILHLKRFQYVPGQYFVHREKINEVVDFPVEGLDLSSYVKGAHSADAPPVYDLYAVSHHSGGLGGGHYTATCKNFENNKWYNFNDSFVSETDPARAVSSTAYVLFYKRRAGTLKWSGIVPSATPIPDED